MHLAELHVHPCSGSCTYGTSQNYVYAAAVLAVPAWLQVSSPMSHMLDLGRSQTQASYHNDHIP